MAFTSIHEIERLNRANGYHFFDADWKRFFSSRILSPVYAGRFFVTSEKFRSVLCEDGPRLYTVHRANDDGSISTVGQFQAYRTRSQAIAAAKRGFELV